MAERFPTVADLEKEWRENLNKRQRQTPMDLLNDLQRLMVQEIPENLFWLFDLKVENFIKRRAFIRYYRSARLYAWRRALLSIHPQQVERIMSGFDETFLAVHQGARGKLTTIRNDLDFFEVVTDRFEEDGFLSVALHISQRILGEIEQKPDNLIHAVRLSEHLHDVYEQDRERFRLLEVVGG